jgi:hypothetical protein
VEGEQRVHGAVERRYWLPRELAVIDREAAASMSLEEHRHGPPWPWPPLLAEFNAYLDRPRADPTADSVGYRQVPLWLNQDELAELISEGTQCHHVQMDNKPSPDPSPYLLSPILFPVEELPQHGTDQ